MKKVTISIDGINSIENAKKLDRSLNELSGIVAADVSLAEDKAYVYAGDQLSQMSILKAVSRSGLAGMIDQEEYYSEVYE